MRHAFAATVLLLATVAHAQAGPMPQLPDLPPLPASYDNLGSNNGLYAGVLGGVSIDTGTNGVLGMVVGHTVVGSDLILSLEALTLFAPDDLSAEADMRLGFYLADQVVLFGQVGLGAGTRSGVFATAGTGLEFGFSEAVSLRAQYQYVHDLSGDAPQHRLLAGATFGF